MTFEDLSKTLFMVGAGVGIGYYLWVVKSKNSEITNPDEIDMEERMAAIEKAIASKEKRQLVAAGILNGEL
jgi:hypothetical protein